MKKLPDNTPAVPEGNSGHSFILEQSAQIEHIHLKEGDVCPKCNAGKMQYDGLLNLSCDHCGYCGERGVFTC